MKKRVVCFMLILALLSATVLSTTAFAETSYYSATNYEFDYDAKWALHFTMRPYLYYTSNTSTSITVDHMEMLIYNMGVSPLTVFQFNAYNGTGLGNNKSPGGDLVYTEEYIEIYQYEASSVKITDWADATGLSATYTKNTNGATFVMSTGGGVLGSTQITAKTNNTFTCYSAGNPLSLPGVPEVEKMSEISFSGFDTDFSTEYSVDNVRSADKLSYIEVSSPKLIDSNGIEHELTLEALENGKASYLANVSEDDIVGATVVSPVIYMEQAIDTIEIPVNADASNEVLDTVEIMAGEQEDESYVVVKFTACDPDFIPYDMVLVSDGVEYKSVISAHNFDTISGDFTRGCYVFKGISFDELGDNLYLRANSAIEKCVLEPVVNY